MVREEAQQGDHGGGFGGVLILERFVVVESAFGMDHVDAGDAECVHGVLHHLRAADEPEQDVRGNVVGEAGGEAYELAQRDVHAGVRMGILQRTIGAFIEIGGEKRDLLVEIQLAGLDLLENSDGEGELEGRLHGWVAVRVQVAVELGAGQRARDVDFAIGVFGDGGDLLVERRLGGERRCEDQQSEGVGEAHVVNVAERVGCG